VTGPVYGWDAVTGPVYGWDAVSGPVSVRNSWYTCPRGPGCC